jgi:hypothetical protein
MNALKIPYSVDTICGQYMYVTLPVFFLNLPGYVLLCLIRTDQQVFAVISPSPPIQLAR